MNEPDKAFKLRRMLRLAQLIWDHWSFDAGMNTDLFQAPLIPDHLVIAGQSVNSGSYREHIVPRKVIRDECFKMFQQGASIEEVQSAIIANLKIVTITYAEAELINKKFKMKMPQGWVFGKHDPFARLNKVGIKFIHVA